MARTPQSDPAPDLSGTYEVKGVGLVLNGVVLDGNDLDAVAAYHAEEAAKIAANAAAEAAADADVPVEAPAAAPQPVDVATPDVPSVEA